MTHYMQIRLATLDITLSTAKRLALRNDDHGETLPKQLTDWGMRTYADEMTTTGQFAGLLPMNVTAAYYAYRSDRDSYCRALSTEIHLLAAQLVDGEGCATPPDEIAGTSRQVRRFSRHDLPAPLLYGPI